MLLTLGLAAGCTDSSDDKARPSEDNGGNDGAEAADAPDGQRAKRDSTATPSKRTARQLEALGYVESTPTDNPDARGVTTEGADTSVPALNLYSSRRRASARLLDMDGELVHRWQDEDAEKPWMHVEPLPSGDLLAIAKDRYLARYDWASNRIWRRDLRAHHDLAVREGGQILALVRERDRITMDGRKIPILADTIAVLSEDGEVTDRIELAPLMRRMLPRRRLARVRARRSETSKAKLLRPGGLADVLHTNSIAILEHDIPGVAPAGSILLSFRTISRIAILNADMSEVLWHWGRGELDGQHDATQLGNGHIMLFDNGLRRRSHSRVIEVDPATERIVWRYGPKDLYSRLRGGAQALDNGHVLITESDAGRVIEVTRSGEMVWEFWNPDVRGSGENAERGVIYRMNRFPEDYFDPLANAAE